MRIKSSLQRQVYMKNKPNLRDSYQDNWKKQEHTPKKQLLYTGKDVTSILLTQLET